MFAYNAGPKRVKYWRKLNGDPSKKQIDYVNWIELIKFKETRNYVQRVLENANVYRFMLNEKKSNTKILFKINGGEREIRTLGTTFQSYVGLANRWFKPTHPSHQKIYIYHFQNIKKTFLSSLKVLIIKPLAINNIIIPKDQFIINNP